MELVIVLQITTFVSVGVLGLLAKSYLPSYFQEKAKNLATKEDIGSITREVESVKAGFSKEQKLLKQALRFQQAERERRMNLRREVYLEAAEALGRTQEFLASFSRQDLQLSQLMDIVRGVPGSLNKFHLVASEDTIEAETEFGELVVTEMCKLLKLRLG